MTTHVGPNKLIQLAVLVNLWTFWFFTARLGEVSLVLLRDLALLGFILVLVAARSPRIVTKSFAIYLAIASIFAALVWISSVSRADWALTLPLYIRISIVVLTTFLIGARTRTLVNSDILYQFFYKSFLIFGIFSLLMYPFDFGRTEVGALTGVAGQHFSKFIFVCSSFFFTALICEKLFSKRQILLGDFIGFFVSFSCLVLVLQRGALVAFTIGFIFMWRRLVGHLSPLKKLLIVAVTLTGFATTLSSERFLEYAFFENVGPMKILTALTEGSFTLDMIRSRGRLDMADALLDSADISAFGEGPGTAKAIIGAKFFEGREPHNDILTSLVDLGYAGTGMLLLVLTYPLWWARRSMAKAAQFASASTRVLYTAGCASYIGFLSWMPFSNVLVYANYNLLLALLMFMPVACTGSRMNILKPQPTIAG